MKRTKLFCLAAFVMGLMATAAFTSCGDDDDDSSSYATSRTVTVEGISLPSLDYVSWCEYRGNNTSDYEITWATYAPGTYQQNMESAYVKVRYSSSRQGATELPTGTFPASAYHASGYMRWQGAFEGFDTTGDNTATLTVEKSGNGYKVSVNGMTVITTIKRTTVKGSISYTGDITKE